MENWTEIKIAVNAADIDRAGDIANEVAPSGIYIEDYRDMEQVVEDIAHIDLIDEELLRKDRTKAFVHMYVEPDVSPAEAVAFLSARYGSEGIAHEIELLDCAEEDWRNNWKQYFHPLAVGKSLMIVPSWYENVDLQGRTPLTIDPGLAFGTGGHETTRLCLEMCEKYMKPGDSVLDVGCGSGILGIAARSVWILTKRLWRPPPKTPNSTALATASPPSAAALQTRWRAHTTSFSPTS